LYSFHPFLSFLNQNLFAVGMHLHAYYWLCETSDFFFNLKTKKEDQQTFIKLLHRFNRLFFLFKRRTIIRERMYHEISSRAPPKDRTIKQLGDHRNN